MLKKEMLSQEKLQNFCKSVPAKTKQTNKQTNKQKKTQLTKQTKKPLVLCEISLVALKMLTAQISQVKQTIYFFT